MRTLIALATLVAATAAPAMTLQQAGVRAGGGRAVAADPDSRLEATAAAATRVRGSANGRQSKADRSILKDDPYLRAAFAWLDNK